MTSGKHDFRRLAAWMTSFLVAVTILAPFAAPAGAVGTFEDDDGNIHEAAIEDIASKGITRGCNPPDNTLYCPDDYVTREQMASFLVRTFDLPPAPTSRFTDTSSSVHADNIEALAASGITKGCNPPENTQYCPTDFVTRGQMAAFIARGLDLAGNDQDFFTDDDGNIFERQIDAIARTGITRGCNPPINDQYCPDRPVRRDQMATFLSRVTAIVSTGTTVVNPPSTTATTAPGSTTSSSTTAPSTTTTLPQSDQCVTAVPTDALIVGNPFIIQFDGTAGGLCDKQDDGTGFTWLDQPSNGTGYMPSLLDVADGRLSITTTSGLFDTTSNSQDNALAVGLNPQITYSLETEIDSPPAGTGNFEQGGLWWGLDEDNYVKVVYLVNATGPAVQIRLEEAGVTSGPSPIQLGALPTTLELRLEAELENLRVEGSYRLDGAGSWVSIGTVSDVPVGFWTVDQAGTTTNTFGGLMTSHRNGPSPVTFSFDRFEATGTVASVSCDPISNFDCLKTPVNYKPTSMEWHGGKLYVLDVSGVIHRYEAASDGTLTPDGTFDRLPPPSGGVYTALGMAMEPGTDATNPEIWITTSITGGSNFLEGVANSSTVWRIDLATSAQAEPQITGLPRAFENHSINSIHFHDGQLYIAQGGNTGAGAPNTDPGTDGPPFDGSAFGTRPEQPLSSAWLRADVLGGWDSDLNGNCGSFVSDGDVTWDADGNATVITPPSASKTKPATCDVEVMASGLRNMYDFVFHSNGNAYGADNGLGVNGTVPIQASPDCQGIVDPYPSGHDPGPQADLLHILAQGSYYGHPNPARDECVFFDGAFQGVGAEPNFVPAYQVLNTAVNQSPRSLNSIIEYKGSFSSVIGDGDLLLTAFAGTEKGVFRIAPMDDGCTSTQPAWQNGCLTQVGGSDFDIGAPLGLTQISEGRLVIGEWITRQEPSSFLMVLTPTG